MDPDHVISGMGTTGSNRESIYYLLNLRCGISSFYIYLYYIGSFYDANIQYVQLLYWAILVVHIYYSVSFILGYSNRTKFYNKPIILYGSIFYFWFSLPTQYCNTLNSIFGLLYYPYYIFDLILFLVYYISPYFFCSWSRLLDQHYYTGPL